MPPPPLRERRAIDRLARQHVAELRCFARQHPHVSEREKCRGLCRFRKPLLTKGYANILR